MAVSAKGIPYIAFSTVCPKQRSVQITSPFFGACDWTNCETSRTPIGQHGGGYAKEKFQCNLDFIDIW